MRGDRPYTDRLITIRTEFTPHARGSTSYISSCLPSSSVYPACAGIDPYILTDYAEPTSLPRMRGDRPPFSKGKACLPRMRGSTSYSAQL